MVSIPNGMEFYPAKTQAWAQKAVSIPNGMEFYGNYYTDPWLMEKGFNSQRDGILRAAYVADTFAPGMFQFPTGWNSTISANTLLLKDSVSIPNGMEFYHTRYISSFS